MEHFATFNIKDVELFPAEWKPSIELQMKNLHTKCDEAAANAATVEDKLEAIQTQVNEANTLSYSSKQENSVNSMDITLLKHKILLLEHELAHCPTTEKVDSSIEIKIKSLGNLVSQKLSELNERTTTKYNNMAEEIERENQAINLTWMNRMVANMNNSMTAKHCKSDGDTPLKTLGKLAVDIPTYLEIAEEFRNMIGQTTSTDQGHSRVRESSVKLQSTGRRLTLARNGTAIEALTMAECFNTQQYEFLNMNGLKWKNKTDVAKNAN
jgi:hypothetical protein